MNIHATTRALQAWESLPKGQRARTLAATYFVPQKLSASAPDGEGDAEYKHKAVDAVASSHAAADFCPQWQSFLQSLNPAQCRRISATPQSRLLVNLSGSITENAGLAMEYICGIPVIPGSAVKGAARRYAAELLKETQEPAVRSKLVQDFLAIFGSISADYEEKGQLHRLLTEEERSAACETARNRIGCISFLQAVPESNPTVTCEVQTPHHRKYMASTDPKAKATDDELPVPLFFPAVEAGKYAYTFCLYSPARPDLLDTAEEWLTQGLTLFGIGAKGSSGFGLFAVKDKKLNSLPPELAEALLFIRRKEKISDLLKTFHKDAEKKPQQCAALLRALCDPQEEAHGKVAAAYLAYLQLVPQDKKEIKSREKALQAMQQLAVQLNYTLPQS